MFLNILVPQISWLVFPFDQQFWYPRGDQVTRLPQKSADPRTAFSTDQAGSFVDRGPCQITSLDDGL